jgi:hydroxymethylbilane synthase
MSGPLVIASRGSELALWQTRSVQQALLAALPGAHVEIRVLRTTGDRVQDVPLSRIGDKGLFTRELDQALLDGQADLAVHSLKDVPTQLPPGLEIVAVSRREDARDVLLLPGGAAGSLAALPAGGRVGTSSLRRKALLGAVRPELEAVDLRGNLNTRLARLDAGDYQAIILAAAGVLRLGWEARIAERLDAASWVPAVGQGALAVVGRAGEPRAAELLAAFHDPVTAACTAAERALLKDFHDPMTAAGTAAERAFLARLEGGCQIPIGALASLDDEGFTLQAMVSDAEGREVLRDGVFVAAGEPGWMDALPAAGVALADRLLALGAGEILARVREGFAATPAAP